jgi:hypothetical protein
MTVRCANKRRYGHFFLNLGLAYFLPVLGFFIVDALFNRRYYSLPNDDVPLIFELGLNIISGTLNFTHDQPACRDQGASGSGT